MEDVCVFYWNLVWAMEEGGERIRAEGLSGVG